MVNCINQPKYVVYEKRWHLMQSGIELYQVHALQLNDRLNRKLVDVCVAYLEHE